MFRPLLTPLLPALLIGAHAHADISPLSPVAQATAMASLPGGYDRPGDFTHLPPARYRSDATATVRFTGAPDADCRAAGGQGPRRIEGCVRGTSAWLPNPCGARWRTDPYATGACHELGHVNGWPADHPDP